MAENQPLNIGIILVHEVGVPCSDKDIFGQYIEKLLSSQKYFKTLTIRRRNIENDSVKLKFLIEQWTKHNAVDLILIFGRAVLPLYNKIYKQWLLDHLKEFPYLNKLMFQIHGNETGNQVYPRCNCYIFSETLIIKQNIFIGNCESFFENVANDILLAIKELKICAGSLYPLTTKTAESDYNSKSKVVPILLAERPRHSIFPMISVSEALECVLKKSKTLQTTWKSLKDCLSFVLAEDVVADEPYPPFNASIKDGYAVLAEDVSTIRDVIGVVTPGCELNFDMKPGVCIRVSTGSAIPNKADAVIQVEDTLISEKDSQGNELKIEILKQAKPFQDIRIIGSDVSVGEVLIPSKRKISAAEIGVLAVCGIQKVLVFQKPWVALLSTGDEVLEPHLPLEPGCIRDSNKSSLMNLLIESRIPFIDAGITKDTADDIKSHLTFAMESANIIITTGSVSMGEKDMLKLVLEQDFEATIEFGRVLMKPGKPTTFSTVNFNCEEKLVFSLPGNPVSAYVCFYLFVIPCIKKLMGYKEPKHTILKVEIAHDIKLDERPEFYRVSLEPGKSSTFVAYSTGSQQSSRLLSMQNADALLVLPPRTPEQLVLKAGFKVDAILLKQL